MTEPQTPTFNTQPPEDRADSTAVEPAGTPEAGYEEKPMRTGNPAARGNMLLVGLLAAGIAAVFFLSTRQGPEAASASTELAEKKVDLALAEFSKAKAAVGNKDTKKARVLAILNYKMAERQIPSEYVRGNPFAFVPPGAQTVDSGQSQEDGARAIAARNQLSSAMSAAKNLELQSVLTGGSKPIAIISEKLLREGQTIDGWTVTEIRPRRVRLQWKNHTHVLNLAEPGEL